ncbi:MAG: GGDEF domain-containing protein [Pseudomonadota bacterium]
MDMGLSALEGRVLHGLLEEASGDIVIKLDEAGFILHASANVVQLGEDLTSRLLMPHISDLAEVGHGELVNDYAQQVLTGLSEGGSVEFPVVTCASDEGCLPAACRRWYALSLRPIIDEPGNPDGKIIGALGLLRSVQHLRLLEGELHARAVTDPLTGLANRHAFCASLRRQLAHGSGRVVVVFAVDRMRAMFLQYGQRTADEILWGFAKFLETMTQPNYELAQLDNERFGVMLSDMTLMTAREWAEEVLQIFSALAIPSSAKAPQLSASAGLAKLEHTVDWTLRQAELALVMARAGGGMQVGQCDYQTSATVPHSAATQPALSV